MAAEKGEELAGGGEEGGGCEHRILPAMVIPFLRLMRAEVVSKRLVTATRKRMAGTMYIT